MTKSKVVRSILTVACAYLLVSNPRILAAKDQRIDLPVAISVRNSGVVDVATNQGTNTYTETINNAPGMGEYRWFNEDFGWRHSFLSSKTLRISTDRPRPMIPRGSEVENRHVLTRSDLTLFLNRRNPQQASLSIEAWDVDADATDDPEVDQIYLDGQLAGTLTGSSDTWSTTTFPVNISLLSDEFLDVFLNIDATHTDYIWAVTIGSSTLNVEYVPEPVRGETITLQSNRAEDDITQPKATNGNGEATASVETRDQLAGGGTSEITAANSDIKTEQPAMITWLPADYEAQFWVTCYSTELESDYLNSQFRSADSWTWCGGTTPPSSQYRQHFMQRVRFQGSGVAQGGEVIQFEPNQRCYYVSSCPLTASGQCAQVGLTIAVDKNIIPFRSTVSIDGVGQRQALDTGQQISGYDIDVYNGVGQAACQGWDNQHRDVQLISY